MLGTSKYRSTLRAVPPKSDFVPFACHLAYVDGRATVSVEGEVDVDTAPALRGDLAAALALPATRLGVDLERVTFLDTAGLAILVGAHRAAVERDIAFTLGPASVQARRTLELCGLGELLGLEPAE